MRPSLSDYEHLASGKVRELYSIDGEHLLFVATDRISRMTTSSTPRYRTRAES